MTRRGGDYTVGPAEVHGSSSAAAPEALRRARLHATGGHVLRSEVHELRIELACAFFEMLMEAAGAMFNDARETGEGIDVLLANASAHGAGEEDLAGLSAAWEMGF